MKRLLNQRGQVLVILVSTLFLGGAAATITTFMEGLSAKDMKKAAKKEIADDSRKDALLELIDAWNKEKKKYDKEIAKGRKRLIKIIERYDGTREDLQREAAKLKEVIRKSDQSYLDLRFDTKKKITRDEWSAIFARINE